MKRDLTRPQRFLRDFASHEIKESSETSWLLQMRREDGRWAGNRWMEVTSLRGGKLLVHGDFNPIVFAYSDRSTTPVGKVHWMGKSYNDAPSSYFIEKATIGSSRDAIIEWNHEKAMADVEAHAAFLEEHGDTKEAGLFREALSAPFETDHELIERLYEFDSEPWDYDFGYQPKAAVLAAWATLVRLNQLLEAA